MGRGKWFQRIWWKSESPLFYYLLLAISAAYWLIVMFRNLLYSLGIARRRSVPSLAIISVGNLTVGGAGKTPMAIYLAGRLSERGLRVVVISRGYKAGCRNGVAVVSDGRRILLDPIMAGDEPYLIAMSLPGIPVIIGKDRFKACLLARRQFRAEIAILDDAFQHIPLERDLDVLLLDAERALGNGRLLPAGPLREPAASLARADMIVFTKAGKPDTHRVPEVVAKKAGEKPLFFSYYEPVGLRDPADWSIKPVDEIRGEKVVAFCGIANADSFFRMVEKVGARISAALEFEDHHVYDEGDIKKIREISAAGQPLITTEKDLVKLRGKFKDIYALIIANRIEDERRFLETVWKEVERAAEKKEYSRELNI